MNFELQTLNRAALADCAADALVLFCSDSADTAPAAADDPLGTWAQSALADGDWERELGACLLAQRLPGVQARRVLWVRCGDASPAAMRKAALAAWGALKSPGLKRLALWAGDASPAALNALLLALAEASYSYTHTKPKAKPRSLQRVLVAVPDAAALQSAFAQACACIKGVEWAREWANRPPNHATPSLLAEAALALARKPDLTVEVLGPKEVERLGMGAFSAVARGSDEPLRFIILHYRGAPKDSAPVVLVGKGITFDSGGISLKPGPEMDEMKFDMAGAASVLGAFVALAELRPAINVVGLLPCCENLPDGRALKPGDVVTSLSGQTIEVLNTDAEGRLLLCDALSFAARYQPRALIDVATLTGACVVALGSVRAGLYANRDELAQALQDAGAAAQDPCWRMPLDADYAEGLKSNFADLANIAGRPAGSVTAAKFLQSFVAPEQPWAHLDIAGVAWKGGSAKGATGRPVPLLVQYLLDEAARLAALEPASRPAHGAEPPGRAAPKRKRSRDAKR